MEIRSWGVLPEQGRYSVDWDCPNCGWRPSVVKLERYDHMVGFQQSSGSGGVLVIECPHCFEKFWNHASRELIENLIVLGKWSKE